MMETKPQILGVQRPPVKKKSTLRHITFYYRKSKMKTP